MALVVKNLPANSADEGDVVQSLGQEDPSPGEGNGNPLQCSCLENHMEGGAWWATVHGVAKSQTGLSDFTYTLGGAIWRFHTMVLLHFIEIF